MRVSKILLCGIAAGALLPAVPAEAQRISRIVAVGDSYADDGNVFQLSGTPPPAIYPRGRFSDGGNFVDTMGQLLNVRIDNFAIGGALTGPGNTGTNNISSPFLPGFQAEVAAFLAGGGPAAFPRVTGAFDPTDLLVVSIGGNDARAYQFGGGTVAGAPGAAAVSVGEARAGLDALVGAGARNITFLAGDVGRLPEVAGNPIGAIGTAFSTSFNNGMQSVLAGYAANGVIVNYLDLNLIGDVVARNLGAFGLISAGACPTACVTTNPALVSQYLFYVDQVHLTAAGFAIVGRYAVRQLEAPLHLESQARTGLQTATTFARTLRGRLDLAAPRPSAGLAGDLSFFLSGTSVRRDYADTPASLRYDVDTLGVTGGVEYDGMADLMLGAAINYSRGEAEVGTTGGTKAKTVQLGLYGRWSSAGGPYAEAYGAYGRTDYRIGRDAVIDEIRGDSDGETIAGGARGGYLVGVGGLRVGPVAGVDYAEADIDAYTESGDPVLTNAVRGQKVRSLVGSLGAEARAQWQADGLGFAPYLRVTAEKDFEDDGRIVRYAGTASPTIVNSFVLPGRGDELFGRIDGGVSIALGGSVALEAGAQSTFASRGGEEFAGFLGLRAGF